MQLELLEMRVETALIKRMLESELGMDVNTEGPRNNDTHDAPTPANIGGLGAEWRAWKKLFHERYRDRTAIGVLIMVFQRTWFKCV